MDASRLSATAWLSRAWATALACAWLAAGPALALDPAQPTGRYTVTRWNADDGLPHGQVHAISQDGDGFLWIATWEGTVRFDGRDFRAVEDLNHPDGRRLASRQIMRHGDGMLASVDHLGLMYVPDGGRARPACVDVPGLEVARVAPGTDGGYWIVARQGLYRADGAGACARAGGGDALAGLDVLALLAQEDGSLLVGNRHGLYRWNNGRLETLGADLGLPAGEIRGLVRTQDKALWIGGEHGVWRLRGDRLERLRRGAVEGIIQDRQGALWVAATDSTLLRYWQGEWQQLDQRHGIEGFASGALFEGREGLVWMGTTHGLFRVGDGPVWGVGKEQGLRNDYVRSLVETADGQVWVGHSGGLSRLRDERVEVLLPRSGWPSASVLSLAPASDGGVWAGTYNRGVMHFAPGAEAHARALVPEGSPLATEQVRALLEDPDGTLWIGTERGLTAWRDGQAAAQPFPALPALPVRALHHADDGTLWVGLLGGLARRGPDGRLAVLEPEVDFPALSAFDFLSDPDGTLWIASDRGVLRHRDGAFKLYGRREGLTGSALFRILPDDFGNLWVSSNEGVTRIPRRAFDEVDRGKVVQLDMQSFTRDDGMPSRQSNGGSSPAGWRMASGELWMPTAAGIAVFDPARVADASAGQVALVIDRVLVNGVPATDVPPGGRVLIQYTGISQRSPNSLRYRYRMQGVDADWIEAGTAGEVTYTHLPAGTARFEVQVARAPADWSRPANQAQVELAVATPWWARTSVRLLGVSGLALLLAGLYAWSDRRQRGRQRRLESKVAQRTEELREKNAELEQASREREQLMEQLAHQAHHDALTGLPNRRACDLCLESAVARAEATGSPLCVALLDVDRFKAINDRHGHQVGDQVLAHVGARLLDSLRDPSVFVGRTGGEEFLVVLHDMTLDAGRSRVEQVRMDIAALRIASLGDDLVCTISAGLVERAAGEQPDDLLRRADERLYEAKRSGRDRVVAA
ncbi:two-component regulator propeller domain-containing protein [Luteimonas changyuni]|uniref:two-component regulator propeller domain-containing protein n=1 Tax=Luteimonas sp. MJ145 TaxID=3129234 RepID=UPI0031BBBF3F